MATGGKDLREEVAKKDSMEELDLLTDQFNKTNIDDSSPTPEHIVKMFCNGLIPIFPYRDGSLRTINPEKTYCLYMVNGVLHSVVNSYGAHAEINLVNKLQSIDVTTDVQVWLSASPCKKCCPQLIKFILSSSLAIKITFSFIYMEHDRETQLALRELSRYAALSTSNTKDWLRLVKLIKGDTAEYKVRDSKGNEYNVVENPEVRQDHEDTLARKLIGILDPMQGFLKSYVKFVEITSETDDDYYFNQNFFSLATECKLLLPKGDQEKYNDALELLNTPRIDVDEQIRLMETMKNLLIKADNRYIIKRTFDKAIGHDSCITYTICLVNGSVEYYRSLINETPRHLRRFIDSYENAAVGSELIIWLSYSPRPNCCTALIDFIESKETLESVSIRFAHFDESEKSRYRRALKDLSRHASLSVFTTLDWYHLMGLMPGQVLIQPALWKQREKQLEEELNTILNED